MSAWSGKSGNLFSHIRYQFKNKKDKCQNDDQLKQDIENDNLYNISNLKRNLRLDLDTQNFENQCCSVNELLNKNGLFSMN